MMEIFDIKDNPRYEQSFKNANAAATAWYHAECFIFAESKQVCFLESLCQEWVMFL